MATLTTVGENQAGGMDYALTLENIRSTKSAQVHMGESIYASGIG